MWEKKAKEQGRHIKIESVMILRKKESGKIQSRPCPWVDIGDTISFQGITCFDQTTSRNI